jgi:hypothetical protein
MKTFLLALCLLPLAFAPVRSAKAAGSDAAERAWVNLTQTGESAADVPAPMGDEVFDSIWKHWGNKSEKARLQALPPDQRRAAVFRHYGFLPNPHDARLPLGFVVRKKQLALNCLACHTGQVRGERVLGLPNRDIDLRGFFVDAAQTVSLAGAAMRLGASILGPERGLISPLGIESFALAFRNRDMDLIPFPANFQRFPEAMAGAPAWWNVKYKTHIFADGVIPLNPRFFATVTAGPLASGAAFRAQEPKLDEIFELIRSSQPPRFPGAIDPQLAGRGRTVFENTCAKCHGSYDDAGELVNYPNRIIPLDRVGTDPARVNPPGFSRALEFYVNSWIGETNAVEPRAPEGYLAPPLRGIWATAPYLHNGSVPTLTALLNSQERPTLWKVSADSGAYDLDRVGLVFEVLPSAPADLSVDASEASRVYDSRKNGRGNQGHTFPDRLTPEEKRQVLEYLKTL